MLLIKLIRVYLYIVKDLIPFLFDLLK
jgi:hypothetical protein